MGRKRGRTLRGWCFTRGRRLKNGAPLEAHRVYGSTGDLVGDCCASRSICEELLLRGGDTVSRVELRGPRLFEKWKEVHAEEMKVLWIADVAEILHEFACRCAEDAVAFMEPPDPRLAEVIATKRRWMKGNATDGELAAAAELAYSVRSPCYANVVWAASGATALATRKRQCAAGTLRFAIEAPPSFVARLAFEAKQERRLAAMVFAQKGARPTGNCAFRRVALFHERSINGFDDSLGTAGEGKTRTDPRVARNGSRDLRDDEV